MATVDETISTHIQGLLSTRVALIDSISDVIQDVERVENALRALGVTDLAPYKPDERSPMSLTAVPNSVTPKVRHRSDGAMSALLDLCRESPTTEFDTALAFDALTERGWTSNSVSPRNIVGTSLGKLERQGDLQRVRPGVYRLAPTNVDGPTEVGPSNQNPSPVTAEAVSG